MLENSVIIRFSKISPEEFILSHRKGFIRSIRTAMRTRQKDVVIISVQPQPATDERNSVRHRRQSSTSNNLDVVFTVRKQQVNPTAEGYFSAKEIAATVADNIEEIEEATKVLIEEVVKTKCNQKKCMNGGICRDQIRLDTDSVNTVSTDVTSFVSSHYKHIDVCECREGYGGDSCNVAINACANNPCPQYKNCVPNDDGEDEKGYLCVCPRGFAGPTCDRDVKNCIGDNCYVPSNPVSFTGKSYAQYKIDKVMAKKILEDQLIFTLKIRTVQQTGNLFYAAGRVDYNIFEISNGIVQYRFDLGSGEGLISVSSINVADGEWHDIKLERERNSAKLMVDNKHVAQGSAPGVNGILNLQSNDFYLGAEVRPHPAVIGIEDVQRGFVGCMDDIKMARETVPLRMAGSSTVAVLKRFANVEFTCDAATILQPLGICGTQPCYNGGVCKDLGFGNFHCQCHARFSGKLCQEDTDPCASSPCLYGGKCHSFGGYGNYSCDCPSNISGRRCDFGRFCSPNPCRNGGVCEEGDVGPICMCRGFAGPTCEIDVNECDNQPCGNGATCINEAGSFRCICPPDLTGASCGDPLYSNTISTKLRNMPLEQVVYIASAGFAIILTIFVMVCCLVCNKAPNHQPGSGKNNETRKQIPLNSISPREDYKRGSKMSNLEQRPLSYTASLNDSPYCQNPVPFHNNLDTLRSYGSAGDELENVPPEYQKSNCVNQQININGNTSSDNESLHKQTWSDMQLKTLCDNHHQNHHHHHHHQQQHHHHNNQKLNNETQNNMRCASLKSTGIIQGKLLPVALPNPLNFEDNCNTNGQQYHWDCSDWARCSQNPLPVLTEVPGGEVPDSSSFHSNESNESHPKTFHLPTLGPVDPTRDIETLNEELESDFIESELEGSVKPMSIQFDPHSSLSGLNPLDSGSEDYRFSTVPLVVNTSNKSDAYLRHPNSYLPRYNIQSETDGETSLASSKLLNNSDILNNHHHQIVESDDEEVPAYGFPKRRNRREASDIDRIVNHCGPRENTSLLESFHNTRNHGSNSDLSVQLCEIEDADFDQISPNNHELTPANKSSSALSLGTSSPHNTSGSSKKSVNWSNCVQHTDV